MVKRAIISLVDNLAGLGVLVALGFGLWRLLSILLALAIGILLTLMVSALFLIAALVFIYLVFQFQMPKER